MIYIYYSYGHNGLITAKGNYVAVPIDNHRRFF